MGSVEATVNCKPFLQANARHIEKIARSGIAYDRKFQDENASRGNPCPIAICGMACRLPGGIDNPQSFWDFIVEKREAWCCVPEDRFNVDGFHSKVEGNPGTINMRHGYFLQDDIRQFDPALFSMSRREIERLDPQHRILLEVIRECLESAGETSWRGSHTGCFVGTFGQDWGDIQTTDKHTGGLYNLSGQGDFLLANRVSYEYDLKGPSFTIKTACSSSLTALHLACSSLKNGECEAALVGGTNLIMAPGLAITMTEQGIVSPGGRSRTFDASADGYGRGEAINALYIKRLDDAIRDGNPVRAVIRNSGHNCDGKSANLAAPSSEAHEAVIRATYVSSGLAPENWDVPFVECHGTGTAAGDPIETTAVANVFGQAKTYIGSSKPNVGHSEGASGITSVMKSVLALENQTIPPNINYSEPNPKIPFDRTLLEVPTEPMPWPNDRAERVSINSFGMGGANVHIILESARTWGLPSARTNRLIHRVPKTEGPRLLVLSSHREETLDTMIRHHKTYLADHKGCLNDVAYTLCLRRHHMRCRAFAVVESEHDEVTFTKTPTPPNNNEPGLTFAFTGQGAQWRGMGKELLEHFSVAGDVIARMDAVLSRVQPDRQWTIGGELMNAASSCRLDDAELSQTLCTALQIALVAVWHQLGVVPDSVVGHSSGEIAAAYAAGALDIENAIIIAYMRGKMTKLHNSKRGAMAAVGKSASWVRNRLPNGVVVACENSTGSTTVSGDRDAVLKFADALKSAEPDIFVRLLKVDHAYHSREHTLNTILLMKCANEGQDHMDVIGREYFGALSNLISVRKSTIPFFSSTKGRRLREDEDLDASYWKENLESPVLFEKSVSHIIDEMSPTSRVFLELGPHSTLAGPFRQIFKDNNVNPSYFSTLSRRSNSKSDLLRAVGGLWSRNIKTNLDSITPSGKTLVDLPRYAWHHEEQYWEESRVSKNWRYRKFLPHELLGTPILESHPFHHIWRRILHLENVSWLNGHKIKTDVVFPAAGYISMAGEAVRQLTGMSSYCLKDVRISAALVIDEVHTVELMTSLRREKLNDSLESEYYEFDISSIRGSTSTRHCWGKVKGGALIGDVLAKEVPILTREVSEGRLYESFRKIGLHYTGAFCRLSNVLSDPTSNRSTAVIPNDLQLPFTESFYQIHPSTIDVVFQTLLVSAVQGEPRLITTLSVPTYIKEINVAGGDGADLQTLSHVEETAENTFCGFATSFSNGKVAFSVKGLQTSRFITGDETENDPHAGVQLEWKPHFDFVDPSKLITPLAEPGNLVSRLEEFAYLCVLDALDRVKDVEPVEDHLKKLIQWMKMFADDAKLGKNDFILDGSNQAMLSPKDRERLIDSSYSALLESPVEPIAACLHRHRLRLSAIFRGETQPLDVLMEGNAWHRIYEAMATWNYDEYFKTMAHMTPNLRVLEIGAGTGGTTASVLSTLKSEHGERMYRKYTYTDISSGFFQAASERFREFEAVEYRVLDITKDPLEQGFEAGGYDLIIASNVLHATPCLHTTLSHVKKLLHPQGRLFLQELASTAQYFTFVAGTLPGWWLGEADNRPWSPTVSIQRWDQELKAAGFSGTDTVLYDNPEPHQMNANIIASAAERFAPAPTSVTLIYRCDPLTPLAKEFGRAFEQRGVKVYWHSLMQDSPAECLGGGDAISLVELEHPFVATMTEQDFARLKGLIMSLNPGTGLMWCTQASQIDCKDPKFGSTIGLARTVRSELQTDFATVEVDGSELDNATFNAVFDLWNNFSKRDRNADVHPDFEYAIRKGMPQISRFHSISVLDELKVPGQNEELYSMLTVGRRGFLNTLHWEQRSLEPLADDSIRVRIKAAGINFKDVLTAMNIVPHTTLGHEAAGIVEEVGKDVTAFKVGDKAMIFSSDCLSTLATGKVSLAAKIPDGLNFVEACTMVVVYMTAIRGLIDLARLQKGQSVLIHSACGGVGIAAIYLSKMVGAEIFCTVGNKEKRDYLNEHMGIPSDHIFDSRSETFLEGIMTATDGRGVDVVLNSLSGPLLHASWRCVAKFGSMVEIGKRDLQEHGKLDLNPFLDNRNYLCVDLGQLAFCRPDLAHNLFRMMIQYHSEGHIQPIRPIKAFPAKKVEAAFRYMQKGFNIGKVAIEFPEDSRELATSKERPRVLFNPDRSYILVGGFGGLGRATARWMVSKGARHLAFLSRSGLTSSIEKFVTELESSGCQVQIFTGSVEDLDLVRDAISKLKKPLAGVLHLALKLKDNNLSEMTYAEWQDVQGPRVVGVWNLHNALESNGVSLDFFVIFGSFSGSFGQWGQANYASTNTFLDSFAQYRRNQGLPTTTIDVGAVEDVGYISERPELLQLSRSTGSFLLTEQCVLDSVELAIARSAAPVRDCDSEYVNPSSFGIGFRSNKSLYDLTNTLIYRRDRRFCIARNMERTSGETGKQSTDSGIATFLEQARTNPSILEEPSTVKYLAGEIGRVLFSFLLRTEENIVLDVPLGSLEVDSLVSIEIRNWCRQRLRVELSILQIMSSTLEDISRAAIEVMVKEYNQTKSSQEIRVAAAAAEDRKTFEGLIAMKAP